MNITAIAYSTLINNQETMLRYIKIRDTMDTLYLR